jgi:glycosyltransferase involved in cell wall biosynthesis
MTRLTVFTPAYNRVDTLPRLFDSLTRQQTTDFEWVIVDDGSTDDTRSVVMAWVGQAAFPVRYLYQLNGGKHTATNAGVQTALGDLFWTVDSDDWLPDGAIVRMLEIWDAVTRDKGRTEIAALTGLCRDPNGTLLGDRFPSSPMESNSLEMSLVHHVSGDKSGWTRTDVMKQFPFPEGQHNFVPEGIVWNAIALRYRTIYVNEVFLVVDYQANGLSRGGRQVSPVGMAMYHQSVLNDAMTYLAKDHRALLKTAVLYVRFSRAARIQWPALLSGLRATWLRALVLGVGPLGWYLRRRDRQTLRLGPTDHP